LRSDRVKQGVERAPHRALLKATGVTDADMAKPFVAVVNSYVDVVPGHVHLQAFARVVKDAVRAAGAVPFEFRDGRYARKWITENEAGRPWFNAQRQAEQEQLLEQVGGRLRALMPFLDPVTLRPDGSAAPAATAEPTAVAVSAQEVSR